MAVFNLNLGKLAWLGLLVAATLVLVVTEASSARIRVVPDLVEIGAFFRGAEIALEGEIPPGSEAVVEIRGAAAPAELLRKGRRGGLWMTVGEIEVEDAPNLYLMLSSTPKVPELNGQETPWGFSALKSQVKFRGALAERGKDRFFQEFLALKESEELYGSLPGALRIGNSPEGQGVVKGTLHLPAKVPPGHYQVRLSVVKEGRLLEQESKALEVRVVGFPALLAALAYEHGALYGLMAVVIAIATGFIMGFLFKGKAEH